MTEEDKLKKLRELIKGGRISEVLDSAGNNVSLLSQLGASYFQQNDYGIAERIFEEIVRIDQKNAHAWSNRGAALFKLKEYDRAIKCLDKAIELNPNEAGYWGNKAEALLGAEKYEDAIRCFRKTLELNPNYSILHDLTFDMGISFERISKYEEATKCYDKVLEINPKNDRAWHEKGEISLVSGRYEEAIGYFDKAIQLNPNSILSWNDRGLALQNLGRYDEAKGSLDRASQINPKFDKAWINKGSVFERLGECQEAIKCLDKAIEISPDNKWAWYNRGVVFAQLREFNKALENFEKTTEIDQSFSTAWFNKGAMLAELGRYPEAIRSYDKAIEINPNFTEAWWNKGHTLGRLGNYDDALKCFDRALGITPDFAPAHYNKGLTLLNIFKYDSAKIEFREAADLYSRAGAKLEAEECKNYESLATKASKEISVPSDKETIRLVFRLIQKLGLKEFLNLFKEGSPRRNQLVKDFLTKAHQDLHDAKLLHKEGSYSSAVYYLQQSVEKTTKALGLAIGAIGEEDLKKVGHTTPQVFFSVLERGGEPLWRDIQALIPNAVPPAETLRQLQDHRAEIARASSEQIREVLKFIQLQRLHATAYIKGIREFVRRNMTRLKRSEKGINISAVADKFRLFWEDEEGELFARLLKFEQARSSLYWLAQLTFLHETSTRYPDSKVVKPAEYTAGMGIVQVMNEVIQEVERDIDEVLASLKLS